MPLNPPSKLGGLRGTRRGVKPPTNRALVVYQNIYWSHNNDPFVGWASHQVLLWKPIKIIFFKFLLIIVTIFTLYFYDFELKQQKKILKSWKFQCLSKLKIFRIGDFPHFLLYKLAELWPRTSIFSPKFPSGTHHQKTRSNTHG